MSNNPKATATITTTTTKPDGKPALTPKLRFPEFRDLDGWKEALLKEVLTEHGLQSDGKCEVHSVSVSKGVINQKEHLGRSFAAANTSRYNLAKPHDVIYTKSPTGEFPFGVVKHNHLGHNVIVSPLYGVFSPETPSLGYIFDAYFKSPVRAKNYLAPITQKGAKNTIQITNQTFLTKGLYLPRDPAEQRKIAECLSSIDELIAAQARKLDALKTHKNGLMQQLFPREGETQPRRRFLKFRSAKAWRERKISEVLSKISLPIKVEVERTYREIGVRSHGKGIFHKEPVSGAIIGDKRVFQVVEDALVLNIVFAWEQAVATTSKEEAGMIASHRFPMYVPKPGECDVRFIKHAFLTPQGKHLLGVASPGGAGRNRTLGNDEFEKLRLILPDEEEQTKIADCLFSLDNLIAAQTQKLDALETHKEGLIQQLFPFPEEVET
jgi:type I restriction enzyme S subunit